MARKFLYDGKPLDDPDPGMSIEDVRQFYANVFPELFNASNTEKKDGEDTVITFAKRVGVKGAAKTKPMKLEEAIKIQADCDGLKDCEGCPIAALVKIESENFGVDQVGSMCAWIQIVKALVEEKEYRA